MDDETEGMTEAEIRALRRQDRDWDGVRDWLSQPPTYQTGPRFFPKPVSRDELWDRAIATRSVIRESS